MPKVTLYTTADCPYCWEVRRFLQGVVTFEEVRLDQDPVAAVRVRQLVGDEVAPVVVVEQEGLDPRTIVGWDKQRLEVVLGVKG